MDEEILLYVKDFDANHIRFLRSCHRANVIDLGEKIITEIKKEGVTYADAYASLQYVYSKLEMESNFVQVPEGNYVNLIGQDE